MEHNIKLSQSEGEVFDDSKAYRRLVGRWSYLIITRPNIAFIVDTPSQFMDFP